MYDYIEGIPVEITGDSVVLENDGIGYRIYTSRATIENISTYDEPIKLYTHLQVGEDHLDLYGFDTRKEWELFRKLLPVSRIGPRLAIQILSSIPCQRFKEAILKEDLTTLESIKGVGKKTAKRLILELKESISEVVLGEEKIHLSSSEEMALKALTSKSLGFSHSEARRALQKVKQNCKEDLSTEELVKRTLGVISS